MDWTNIENAQKIIARRHQEDVEQILMAMRGIVTRAEDKARARQEAENKEKRAEEGIE